MHHAGCTTNISDLHARRVLGRKEYRKFVDFYDRSVLGEGIHCLKCGSFVNLPRDGDPMVQCPYCAYRWCVRCKCPLDPGQKSYFIASSTRPDSPVEFYAGGTRISSVPSGPTSRWRSGGKHMARSAAPAASRSSKRMIPSRATT